MQFVFHLFLDIDIFIKLKLKRRAIDVDKRDRRFKKSIKINYVVKEYAR